MLRTASVVLAAALIFGTVVDSQARPGVRGAGAGAAGAGARPGAGAGVGTAGAGAGAGAGVGAAGVGAAGVGAAGVGVGAPGVGAAGVGVGAPGVGVVNPVARGVVATGRYIAALPPGCVATTVGGAALHQCGSTYYRLSGTRYEAVTVQ